MPDQKEPSKLDTAGDVAEAQRKAAPYLAASWMLVGSTGIWTFIGYWADQRFKTQPWLLVTGAFLGMGVGFWMFFRELLALEKKRKKS